VFVAIGQRSEPEAGFRYNGEFGLNVYRQVAKTGPLQYYFPNQRFKVPKLDIFLVMVRRIWVLDRFSYFHLNPKRFVSFCSTFANYNRAVFVGILTNFLTAIFEFIVSK
jgi:hypothetical protein